MKTIKTPEDFLKENGYANPIVSTFIIKSNEEEIKYEYRVSDLITAYHAQFQVTPSERESPEIFQWLKDQKYQKEHGDQEYMMYFDVDMPKILNDWVKHINKSIPPAKQLPTSVEAQEWADNACYDKRTDEGVWIGEYTLNAMMEMYYWLTERLGNETKEV